MYKKFICWAILSGLSLSSAQAMFRVDRSSFDSVAPKLEFLEPFYDQGYVNLVVSEGTRFDLVREAMQGLPDGVERVCVFVCELGHRGSDGLASALQKMPNTVHSVSFSIIHLNALGATNLAMILRALPASVELLDLSSNPLAELGVEKLVEVFAQLPETVTSLSLHKTQLFRCHAIGFAKILRKLTHLRMLDLSENVLCLFEPAGFQLLFLALPQNIQMLNLKKNQLQFFKDDGIKVAFNALPHWLTVIDLSANGFAEDVMAGLVPDGTTLFCKA